MRKTTFDTSSMEKPQKRLYRQYRRLGSFHKVAQARGVNVRYVYQYVAHNVIPENNKIRAALGIRLRHPVTINQLMQLPIQDMPPEILRLSFENREER